MSDNVSDPALTAVPAPAMTPAPDSVAAPASVPGPVPSPPVSLPSPVSSESNQSKSGSVNIDDGSKPDKWPFAEPQPIREDQVRNAVNFLSHPKVRESPVKNRYAFLERKGLTRAEIEEAFRRCGDPSTNEAAKSIILSEGRLPAMPSNEKPGGYQQSVVSMQPQVAPPYTARPPASVLPIRSGLHWWHLIAGASCIAAAGAGTGYFFQKVLAPKLKSWLRDILLNEGKHKELKGEGQSKAPKLSPLEEAVAAAAGAANAAAAAASEVANSSREVMKLQAEEWQHLRSLMKALDNKTEELKSTVTAMSKANLENTSYHKVEGIAKPYQLSSSPAEQLQTKQGLQGYQTSNGGDRIHTNGYTTNYNNYVSQSEDEPWWHRRKVEVETYASPKQQIESSFHVSEVEAGMDQPIGANVSWTSTQSKVGMGGRQGWVPPPVPQTVNPAAASAIRYQKPATVDEAKHTSIVEGKEVLSQQSSPFLQAGLLDSSSSVMFSNPTKANEDKPRVVIEDPANTGGEGKLEIATEEKEMTAQRLYGLPNMQESPKVADFASIDKEIPIRLEHPASVNEAEARIITNGEPSSMREVGRVTEITPIEKEISSSSSKDWSSHSAEF